MFENRTIATFIIAVLIGLAYSYLVGVVWGYYVVYHPLNSWLLEHVLIPGNRKTYYILIYLHDILVNIALAYPFAIVFSKVTLTASRWKYLLITVLAIFIWTYRLILTEPNPISFFTFHFPGALLGLAMTCGSLPLAYLLVVNQRGQVNAA